MKLNWVQVNPGKYRCTHIATQGRAGRSKVWAATVTADMAGWSFTVRCDDNPPVVGTAESKELAIQRAEAVIQGTATVNKAPDPPPGPATPPPRMPTVKPGSTQPYVGACPNCGAVVKGTRKVVRLGGAESFLRRCKCRRLLKVTAEVHGTSFRHPVDIVVVKPRQERPDKITGAP